MEGYLKVVEGKGAWELGRGSIIIIRIRKNVLLRKSGRFIFSKQKLPRSTIGKSNKYKLLRILLKWEERIKF